MCADGGIWFGEVGLRALAKVIEKDIVVVRCSDGGMTVYPCFSGKHMVKGEKKVSGDMGRFCSTGKGSLFTPLTVFKPSTVVLAHNGFHYWCTKIGNPSSMDISRWLDICKRNVDRKERRDIVAQALSDTNLEVTNLEVSDVDCKRALCPTSNKVYLYFQFQLRLRIRQSVGRHHS